MSWSSIWKDCACPAHLSRCCRQCWQYFWLILNRLQMSLACLSMQCHPIREATLVTHFCLTFLDQRKPDSKPLAPCTGPDQRRGASAEPGGSEAPSSASSEWADDSFMPGDDNTMFGSDAWEAKASGRGGNEASARGHGRHSMWFRQRHSDQRHGHGSQPENGSSEAREQMAAERASMAGGTVFDSRWDQQKGGPSQAGRQSRHDRETGGTQFDSRWDNP